MTQNNYTNENARLTSAIAGIRKYFPGTAPIVLAGTTYSPAELVSLLQACAGAITAILALHAQLKGNVATLRSQRKQTLKVLHALEGFVDNFFGGDPSKLADFGFKPKKVRVETAAKRAEGAAKAAATRKAKATALKAVTSPAAPPPATSNTTTKS
jgi:hypothetical protein